MTIMLYDTSSLIFLSTLSLRRATSLGLLGWLRVLISIHALLAESDANSRTGQQEQRDFYPRSPCGERRSHYSSSGTFKRFLSTLSLRRATIISLKAFLTFFHFYPRSPCGERQDTSSISIPKPDFYPRSPCGERQTTY